MYKSTRMIWTSLSQYILGRNGIYFTWVSASYRGEARGLLINTSPRERSSDKFHLSEFRIWKGISPWGNRGDVACHLLRMKTSATNPQPQVASQHLDGAWTRHPSPLATAMLVWYGEHPRGITPLAESRGRTHDLPRGKPVAYHKATGATSHVSLPFQRYLPIHDIIVCYMCYTRIDMADVTTHQWLIYSSVL